MARPSFKIDQFRLLSLRQESNLTQLNVAKKIHSILDKSPQMSNATMLSSYQRIEKTGKTSKKMAAALAQVLETTIEILQGMGVPEDSANFIRRIEQQLREQSKSGNNPVLQRALQQHAETYRGKIDEVESMRDFAEDVGTQIEVAQIGQDPGEIARLVELTGWSEAQLMQPGGVHGHWLLLTTVHGYQEREIILGVHAIQNRINETFKKEKTIPQSDHHITLRRSLPWFHVDIAYPRTPDLHCKFSFVRCRPEVDGLKWVNPNWRDEFWLDDLLKRWASSEANFFTDFDGKNHPDDVRRLRFRVQERDAKKGYRRVAYSAGHLKDLHEETFQSLKKEGNSHLIVINRLAHGLVESLAPHLTAYPPECWSIRPGTSHIAILLAIPFRLLRENYDLAYSNGVKYSIDLVEETSPGFYETAPWRTSSVAEVSSLLEKHLFEKFDDSDHEGQLQFNAQLPDGDGDGDGQLAPLTEVK